MEENLNVLGIFQITRLATLSPDPSLNHGSQQSWADPEPKIWKSDLKIQTSKTLDLI